MIVLENGDGLNVARLTGSASLEIIVNYRRISGSVFEPQRQLSFLVNDPDVDILVNSESGYSYLVESIYIRSHPDKSKFNLNFEVSGTPEATLISTTLKQGESLHYDHKKGYRIINRNGSGLKIGNKSANEVDVKDMVQDVSPQDSNNNNAVANTLQNVDGSFFVALPTGKYYIRIVFHYTSQATGTGSRFVPWLSDFQSGIYTLKHSLTTTNRSVATGLSGNEQPSACNTTSAATAANIAIIEGFVESNSPYGAIYTRFASEVANSLITAKAKSFMQVIPVD